MEDTAVAGEVGRLVGLSEPGPKCVFETLARLMAAFIRPTTKSGQTAYGPRTACRQRRKTNGLTPTTLA